MMRIAACAVMGLGAALLIAALLLSTYTAGKIAKIPLDLDVTLVGNGSGAALDPESLGREHAAVDHDVPLVSQEQITVESPANADVVTLQVGSSLRRGDRQKDTGLLLAIVDTVTLNRTTARAISDDTHPGGSVQRPRNFGDENPPTNIALPHEGLSYRFPFDTKKQSYQYFDPIAQKAYEANYEGEDDVNGLTTYRFLQNVGYDEDGSLNEPIRYPSLYGHDEDGEITAPARMWNIEGADPDEDITMTRYYAAQRTMWVDPVSGTIVKSKVHANHYYARDPLKPEVALVDYTITSSEETIEAQVDAARNERDRLALWSRVLPITFTAAGLICLLSGVLVGWFSLPAEAALGRPGRLGSEEGFFGGFAPKSPTAQQPSGAEAETEKLPTQRPQLDRPSAPPEPSAPDRGTPDSAPDQP
ncbi:membrane protein [Mycolicibacter hiberniae]|uniref:Membrane protein n=2 Tax=Mycolicibacter hiberniae TaxID=29314 RepID=A0A7I7X8A1_9MYCO|nr:membrane protein [Mycolicibacter hiberniae]